MNQMNSKNGIRPEAWRAWHIGSFLFVLLLVAGGALAQPAGYAGELPSAPGMARADQSAGDKVDVVAWLQEQLKELEEQHKAGDIDVEVQIAFRKPIPFAQSVGKILRRGEATEGRIVLPYDWSKVAAVQITERGRVSDKW